MKLRRWLKIFTILVSLIFTLSIFTLFYIQTFGRNNPRFLAELSSPSGKYKVIMYTFDNYINDGGVKIINTETGKMLKNVSLPSFDERHVDSVRWVGESKVIIIMGYDIEILIEDNKIIINR